MRKVRGRQVGILGFYRRLLYGRGWLACHTAYMGLAYGRNGCAHPNSRSLLCDG